jgi:tetratricopeptide (TPR) repeat protein
MSLQDRYDDAMFDFSRGDYDSAIAKLQAILAEDPGHFDARLSLGMAYYRKGDFGNALKEGHEAERLRPDEQLVHTNLSLFYQKSGDKVKAEQHGLKARIASWKSPQPPASSAKPESELQLAQPPPPTVPPVKFPERPWKKAKAIHADGSG